MKQIYELITYPLSVIENPFYDSILLTIIGMISFAIAWNFVRESGIRGKVGSILHWTVRLFVMIILTSMVSIFIKIGIYLYNNLIKVYTIIFLIIMIIGMLFAIKQRKKLLSRYTFRCIIL